MNILILNWRDRRHPKSGGAEIVTMEHAKGWVKLGHTVTWLTSGYDGARQNEKVEGVSILRRFGSLTIYLFAPLYLFSHRNMYDVIVDEVHGIPFFAPLFTRTPVIVFIHEIAGDIWDFMYPFPINIVGKVLEYLYFKIYKNCFFWTDAPSTIKELVRRGIPEKQCVAIPCPITIDKRLMMKDKKDTSLYVVDHISKEKNPTFIFVSRVVKMKGVEEVIKSFSFIAKESASAKLWIVGGGDEAYIKKLQHMMHEYGILDRVTFWGRVSEEKKYELMAKSHILLHASVKEGWGLVVLEAASIGTPSVVYNVPGLCDVVKNGKTGIVIRNNSPHEMARESLMLLQNKKTYRLFQEHGKAWVKSLRWEDAVVESNKLLQRVFQKTL